MKRWRHPPLYAPNGARLDTVDLELLRRLQADARVQNQTLAREMNLSASGCLQRVRRLGWPACVVNGAFMTALPRVVA